MTVNPSTINRDGEHGHGDRDSQRGSSRWRSCSDPEELADVGSYCTGQHDHTGRRDIGTFKVTTVGTGFFGAQATITATYNSSSQNAVMTID